MKKKYPVLEIFSSIQGEGVHQGVKATFIRLAGCNLRCTWCDTKDSWEIPCKHGRLEYDSIHEMRASDMHCMQCGKQGSREELQSAVISNFVQCDWATTDQIIDSIGSDAGIIVITGGEPTIHNLTPLLEALNSQVRGVYIAIETNGTNALTDYIGLIDWVTVAPKPPLYECLSEPDELKYVVDDSFTVNSISAKYINKAKGIPIFLQVESGRPKSAQRAFDMVMKNSRLRLGTQLHKHLNVR